MRRSHSSKPSVLLCRYVDSNNVQNVAVRNVAVHGADREMDVRSRGFGELETVVMDRVWDRGADTTTVREVFDELAADRDIAYTTVMSTMDNLHTRAGCSASVTARPTAIGPL